MPLSRIFLRKGKSPAYKQAILDGIYLAMRETFDVPENDRFMVVSDHEPEDFNYDASYLGIARSDDLVIIQLTVSNTRPLARSRRSTGGSSSGCQTSRDCGAKTSSSISSRCCRRTGRSVTASRNTVKPRR